MRRNIQFFILFAFCWVISCENKEPKLIPKFELLEVSDTTKTSVVLNAEIIETGSEEVTEFGFIWRMGQSPSLGDPESRKEIINKSFKKGPFSVQLNNLETGPHLFQAYVITAKGQYATEDGFFSPLRPVPESISPMQGAQGTKVTLKGKNFSKFVEKNEVYLAGKQAEVTESTEDQIVFIIPPHQGTGIEDIWVKSDGISSSSSVQFTYLDTFTYSPNEIRNGKVLKVYPSIGQLDNVYKINGVAATPISRWRLDNWKYEIRVKVPDNLPLGEVTIEVEDIDGNALVNINESPLKILPDGIYTQKQSFPGNPGWAFGFTINDIGYVLDFGDLYEYNPAIDSWLLIHSFEDLNNSNQAVFVIEGKAYIFMESNNKLWCLDPIEVSLKEKKSFPGIERSGPVALASGNNGFLGLGRIWDDEKFVYDNLTDFWKYNTTTDTWSRVSDFPKKDLENKVIAVKLNNKGYFFGDDNSWSYEFNNDLFYDENSSAFALDEYVPFFALNDKMYYGVDYYNYAFFEYDPIKKTYSEEADFPGLKLKGGNFFTFVINDKAYFGNEQREFWEFIPALK
ncbi:IPT/TIG domain-containing protein [Xanthovirga aplysinae]|uniref:IPT/TIG domain-containing protein n=1 Tax=Xanthovirga aplysinae TaxID=2529853 RepID=UPI0012BC4907|nr:IPT/TIG domain-containing protein [Xanthovirga aplysinae]MTI30890.1 hypothetical protein [Xanthovirga aplysinae]